MRVLWSPVVTVHSSTTSFVVNWFIVCHLFQTDYTLCLSFPLSLELFHSIVFCLCSLSFYHPFAATSSPTRRNVCHCYGVCTSMECELLLQLKKKWFFPSTSRGMWRSESAFKYSCHEFFQFSISFLFEHDVKVLKFALNAFNPKHRQ